MTADCLQTMPVPRTHPAVRRAKAGLLRLLAVLVVVLLQAVQPARAHQASDAFLSLTLTNGFIEGRLDLAFQDLHVVLDLDDDVDGKVSWGEMKTHREEASGYIRTNLLVRLNDQPVDLGPFELMVDDRAEEAFAVWRFRCATPSVPRSLEVTYRCLFEVDALHRAFLKVQRDEVASTAMLSPAAPRQRFEFGGEAVASHGTAGFIREGVWHIWTGYDHVLFLLALLLPAVVRRVDGTWQPVEALRPALWTVFKTVTAFTAAHSITLSLASLGMVQLPSRLVEPVIAGSVVLAALNNLRPVFRDRGWMVAFGFGLIHGFGFAGVLQEFNLSGGSLLWPLLGFNLGVELGQAAIVVVFVPATFALRGTSLYRIGALRYGSAAIALLALGWLIQRVTGA